ncbi:MAG: glycosyltransferase [Desulfobacula sp.]|jgi:glycosyltransferase involved in cell wall biosynthesis|uniref:glycosyltransferase n=1 Tax=Desulfobacula sp. TaxID=2593537 RepID=UPI001EC9D679|nr:glycosyltransferase [Desulfobacula sp.]MBT4876298.1 glycosyltransferase [Desulfobacula sp.]MBT5546470.1 glycosyltransferase [Desulfobacula sp.]MBT5972715.1 glycosyltransferase [Desulfobacula sp.]MBT7712563.1 glycosyltransferase [Deltaproteobacteria bacterium]
MVKADLHVHSEASKRPSEWFLKKVGARESYTDIDSLYHQAKQSGMDFVTVTDHNTIEGGLELIEKYPEDTFLSVEVTTYFPENNCKIHVLVFDITPEQFLKINTIRYSIYQLRDYLKTHNIAYSVAHGFYNVNKKLSIEILERLILLFDVFEDLNGARNKYYNEMWQSILANLNRETLMDLSQKYGIDPISDDPWIKGFTGGSDDHAGIFIGQTSTISDCPLSRQLYIDSIKNKSTQSMGRCNDYKSFAFSIYKIFCDYSSNVRKNAPGGMLSFINTVVFEDRQSRLNHWITLRKIKKGKQIKDKILLKFFKDVYNWSHSKNLKTEVKIDSIYSSMGLLLDEFFKMLLESFVNDFSKGDVGKLFRNFMSALPAAFISIPFFSSLHHLSRDRDLIVALKQKYEGAPSLSTKKVLWFSDTVTDLNGVSVTLGRFKTASEQRGMNIRFVACLSKSQQVNTATSGMLLLPCIHSITPQFYTSYTLNFPSLLTSMEKIYSYRPDRIIVSTPGPVGLLGMIMAGILGVECVTVYHTDFASQADCLFEDEALTGFIQSYINRFYSFSDQIKVPTNEYIKILEQQNYDTAKMSIFKRGFTVNESISSPAWKRTFLKEKAIESGFTLMWAGRVSKDKNVEFLIDIYQKALAKIPDLNLILCGNGPDLDYFKTACKHWDRIHFTGHVDQGLLEKYYKASDLFVFPSTTDTFGMVILEAQAKGLFALVTDVGGPQEIIEHEKTGYILKVSDIKTWVQKILDVHTIYADQPGKFARMRSACQKRIMERYDWDEALFDILGNEGGGSPEKIPAPFPSPRTAAPSNPVSHRSRVVA